MKWSSGYVGIGVCLAVVCVVCLVTGTSATSAQEKPLKLTPTPDVGLQVFSAAANAQNMGNFGVAVGLWDQFLKGHPTTDETPKAQYYCGVCNRQLKPPKFDEAAKHFDLVVNKWSKAVTSADKPAVDPSMLEEASVQLGYSQFVLAGQAKANNAQLYDKSAKTFAAFLKQFPKSKKLDQGLYFQAEALYYQGKAKLKEAITSYAELVNNPQFKTSTMRRNAVYALGVAYEEDGQFANAGKIYDIFIAEFGNKDKLYTEVYMRKAETILQAGLALKTTDAAGAKPKFAEAEKMFAACAAIAAFNRADHATFQQALCNVELDKFAEAAKLYSQIPAKFSESTYVKDATLNAGRFFYRDPASHEEAATWLQKVVANDPANTPEAAHWLCRIHLRGGKPQLAADLATKSLPTAAESKYLVNLNMDQADALFEIADRKAESLDLYLKIWTAHPQHELAPQALYNAAYTALDLKKYADAAKHCDAFLKAYKGHAFEPDVKYVGAESNLHTKKYPEAEAGYRDLITSHASHPDVPQWQLRVGLVLYLQAKYADTVAWLTPLASKFDKVADGIAEAHFLIGASQFNLNKYDAAIPEFDASLKANPKWRQADETLLLLSQALNKQNKTAEAIAKVKEMITSFPASTMLDHATYRFGEYSYNNGDFKTAVTEYQKVVDQYPKSMFAPFATYGLGWGNLKQAQYAPAIAAFDKLLKDHAGHMLENDAYFARGMCKRQTKDLKGAIADIDSFLKSNPGQPDKSNALYEKGLCEVALPAYVEAVKSFSTLLKDDPKSPIADKVLYEWAWALKSDKKDAEALPIFRKLATEHATSTLAPEANFHDGEDLYQNKKYDEAVKAYLATKTKAPKGSLQEKSIYKLGWSFYQQKKYDVGLKEFAEQVAAYPQGALIADGLFMKAECLFRLEKFDEALPAYQAATVAVAAAKPPVQESVKVLIQLHGGQSAAELKQWAPAIKFLEVIPTEFKNSAYVPEAYFEMGRAQQGLNDIAKAVTHYKKAAELSPFSSVGARARYMIGEAHFAKKQYDDAIKEFSLVMFGIAQADEETQKWQSFSGYEAGRCCEVRIKDAKGEDRTKFIKDATNFYKYVVEKHPKSKMAPEATKRIQALGQLAPGQ